MPATITPFPSNHPARKSPSQTKPPRLQKTAVLKRSASSMLSENLRMVRAAYELLTNTPVSHQRGLSNHILMRVELEMEYLIRKIAEQSVWVDIPEYMLRQEEGGRNGN